MGQGWAAQETRIDPDGKPLDRCVAADSTAGIALVTAVDCRRLIHRLVRGEVTVVECQPDLALTEKRKA